MRVLRIIGALFIIATFYLFFFTDRDKAAMVLLVAGSGLVLADQYRSRAGRLGAGRER